MGNATIKDYIEQVIEDTDTEIMADFYFHLFNAYNEEKQLVAAECLDNEWHSILEQAEERMREDKMRTGK